MKRISQVVCAAAFAMLVASCGGKNVCTVEATLGEDLPDGQTVYLLDGAAQRMVDSATADDGRVGFRVEVDTPWVAQVVSANGIRLQFIAEAGRVALTGDEATGTPLNDRMTAYLKATAFDDLTDEMGQYYNLYFTATDAATRAMAERKYDSLEAIGNARLVEVSARTYAENGDNLVGAIALNNIARVEGYTYAELDSLMQGASAAVRGFKPLQDKMAQMKAVSQTSAGRHYIDIEGVDGRLSDLIDGRLALVDFYASWCGPCRNEIRDNLVPLWAKYKDKGLVIVGLNVWERGTREQREAAHRKVMDDLGITYPQLVDSTRTATTAYGVSGIPQIMLIGRDGTILARDLRGAAIEEAIVRAMSEKK